MYFKACTSRRPLLLHVLPSTALSHDVAALRLCAILALQITRNPSVWRREPVEQQMGKGDCFRRPMQQGAFQRMLSVPWLSVPCGWRPISRRADQMKLERGSIHLYSSHDLGRLACGISRGSPGLVLAQCLGLVSASRVHVLAYTDPDISIYGFIPWHGRTAYVVSGTSATLVFCFGYLSQ